MAIPLLKTKLYIPPVRPGLVSRPRLIERLEERLRLGCKLTLLSAPAGFGKTTLISEWVAAQGRLVAWLSLDESDDLVRFMFAGCWQHFLWLAPSQQPNQSKLPLRKPRPPNLA